MKKITMVNSEQICARGWKGFKTRGSVPEVLGFSLRFFVSDMFSHSVHSITDRKSNFRQRK